MKLHAIIPQHQKQRFPGVGVLLHRLDPRPDRVDGGCFSSLHAGTAPLVPSPLTSLDWRLLAVHNGRITKLGFFSVFVFVFL